MSSRTFRWKTYFEKFPTFDEAFTLQERHSWDFTKGIGRIVQIAFFVSEGTCWRKSGLLETILRFSLNLDSEQIIYTAGVLNLCSRCPEQHSDEKFCFIWVFQARPSCFLFGIHMIFLRPGCRTSILGVEGNTIK